MVRINPEELDAHNFLKSDVLTEWENIVAEKQMPFGVFEVDGGIEIGFQPHRVELSYMDMKAVWDV